MDKLINKSYGKFNYISRYAVTPYYYHTEDEKYIYGIGHNLSKECTYVLHKVRPQDTLDKLALEYYNNPTLYWVIAMFNDVQDIFSNVFQRYETIKIPTISAIEFGDDR